MKMSRSVLAGMAFILVLIFNLHAQQAADSPSDFEVELQALESTTPLPASEMPADARAIYSAQNPDWPPLPNNWLNLPFWPLGDGVIAIDDIGYDYKTAAQSQTISNSQFSKSDLNEDFLLTPANVGFSIVQQSTNIVLNWQSASNRIYLIEQRPTLTSDSYWTELTNYVLSASNTNVTSLVLTNLIQQQPIDFFRLFDVTPIANNDFFSIDQDSSDNQLDIFQNDVDPNGDPIFISNIVPASHGDISYSLDATTFQYTPTAGFYGIDTFQYSITSGYGDISSNATVTVFVNESGNTPPTANNLIFTLQTNVYSVTFNTLTNTTGNTPVLYAVNQPSMGSVSNDASGNITYTRNPNLFGDDAFTYVLTDANGGYALVNVRIEQQDTSGDGLPDQWDLQYGFDPTVDNSMGDPAGDGLPNLVKFVLGLDPTKADNVLNFSSVTNGTQISGFAQLPIYGLSSAIQTPPIIFYVNGLPAEDSVLSQGPDGVWQMNWDTTFLTNGDYQIQLVCPVAPTSSPDSITNVTGTPITVQVNNPITMDKLTHQFSNYLYIYGTLADTNDTYDVYLYDDYGNPLVSATGLSAPDGQIALGWDLTDGNGNQISFGNVQAVFYLHPPGGSGGMSPDNSPSPSRFITWFLKERGSGGGYFSVAWGWGGGLAAALAYIPPFTTYRTELMQDGVINILANPSDPNSYYLLPGLNAPYAGTAFRYDSDSDKSTLEYALKASGYFYWFGHCDTDVIFGNEKHSGLSTGDVHAWLGNNAYASTPKHPKNNKNPYKLVILNACESYNSDWAHVFGVDFSPGGSVNSVADYQYVGRQPRAYVGWTKLIDVPTVGDFSGLQHAQYANALGYLFGYWMDGYPLYYCVGQFAGQAVSYGFTGMDSWQISGCVDLERGD
ncbi:MAG: Ig-like domain-containing protein [Limisphaerales bacterium]